MHKPIPILMYHQIDLPAPRGTRFRSLTVHPKSFSRQMWLMHQLGYQGLSMRDLMPYLRGERTGKVFGITFDDGFRNVLTNALPVLNKFGFTATNYFVANQINGSNAWDAQNNVPTQPLMSRSEILEWSRSGQEVGSHSLDHPSLPELSEDQVRMQINDSRQILSEIVSQNVTAFCYPYGNFLPEHLQIVAQAGYQSATTTKPGLAGPQDETFMLPRVGVWRTTHMLRFLQKCLTRLEDRQRG
jgi:peptidoglycan/xylan/chitin deacetylase (PgdA/CDA1 family)